MELWLIFGLIALSTLISFLIKDIKTISCINISVSIINFIACILLVIKVESFDTLFYLEKILFLDSYSTVQLFIISGVTLVSSIYSYKYILNEVKHQIISIKKAKIFYILFNLFVFSMYLISFANNVMIMWISLEATTLATAFLIGFNGDKLSLEAAWKYIILCSVGITIGLVGIILLIYSTGSNVTMENLNWTYLSKHYSTFDITITKIAFTLIFVGIGTKAGFAPMHTWLSDGHSEAPSPISAMMSGILLNLALYVVVRFYVIIKNIDNLQNFNKLFVIFGVLSLFISSFSILKQNNYKRLLAFSSVENIGIISLGIGFGGYFGLFAAVLHSIIHAFGKTLLFLVAGNILENYKTKRIDKIHYLFKFMPINSAFLILGMLIITGAPPFASFFSEYYILISGIKSGHFIATIIYALCLLIVFAGFLVAFMKMIYTKQNDVEVVKLEEDGNNIVPLIITLVFVVFVSAFLMDIYIT
ncbi:proton-conducting transporter membrane subunit [Caloramator sp. mosi_1]|uniref:proton-conducting transporter transmembrane domain-containing protein n=1 Tax=Caloramator sp. mosi_1 TaxID=3023090 RepID=UPI00235E777D|nr:proton-conducting transporter membrane subunit [Caloramator sp. mosi_1]WDC85174.1 proton-conducting transporter membrane subunit [Caloramator sp. mosi_1]